MKLIDGLLAASTLAIAANVMAHSGATGIVKQRMDAMVELGDHAKLLASMFKGKTAFEVQSVRDAADSFVSHGRQMAEWFPDTENSRYGHKSQSKQVVWEQWDDFVEEVNDFIAASETLQAKAQTTDDEAELRKAFFATAKGCKSCHKVYRKPKSK